MIKLAATRIVLGALLVSGLIACGNSGSKPGTSISEGNSGGEGGTAGNTGGTSDTDGGDGIGLSQGGIADECDQAEGKCDAGNRPSFCSDGRIDPTIGEVCDDGNTMSGDGCTANCAQIEADWVCPTPGEACVSTVKCGDGKISGDEQCDDGNTKNKDGCSSTCQIEAGWACPFQNQPCVAASCGDGIIAGSEQCEDGSLIPAGGDGCDANCQIEPGYVCNMPGEPCTPTVCGDAVKEGSEGCDDGNQVAGDGCSPLCEVEPLCPPTGGAPCTSRCGDGLILPNDNEECDDGNTVDGDGCSHDCKVEPGYQCPQVQGQLPDSVSIPFTFRDFIAAPSATTTMQRHPDFQNGCIGADGNDDVVADQLDVDGKPILDTAHPDTLCAIITPPTTCTPSLTYAQIGANPDACADLDHCTNFRAGLSANCQRATHPSMFLPGHDGVDPFWFWYRDTPDVNKTLIVPTTLTRDPATNVYSYNPGQLFPLDGKGWVASGDEQVLNGHNYSFTSEVHYWFTFLGGETLTFTGDDDLYVFVNGKLALSIGNKHGALTRTVTLNTNGGTTATATCTGGCTIASRDISPMAIGSVYQIAIFHAERQTVASNFNLQLTGFIKSTSQCTPICGDGILTGNEECDNGPNNSDTAYNGCTTQCKHGPSCGDGHVDIGHEECDDGVNLSQWSATPTGGCAPGCVAPPYCGDGIVQSKFETCDDGVLAGNYGGCAAGCVLGPRCGDHIIQQAAGEECDDGNRASGDGCRPNCFKERIR